LQRRAALEIARAQLAETELAAPFDGVVLARHVSPGAYLAVGAGVCELVRVDPLRLLLAVGAEEAGRIAPGTSVRARLAGAAAELTGTVTRLAPALSAASRTRTVEVALPNPSGPLLAGSFAEARLVLEPEARALLVPLTAVRSFAGLDKLCFVLDGVVAERRVELGARQDGRAELVSGAVAGDVFLLEPGNLTSGARVRVVP
ncbi:MAG: efflux RND transporter periplasmic adaptor subunit, partial [Planctomycetota bacterium]